MNLSQYNAIRAYLRQRSAEILTTIAAVPTSRTVNGHALSSNVTVTKGDVGLGSADNTSDADKPVSTATQTALNLKQNSDADLTALAAIAGVEGDIIYRDASGWQRLAKGTAGQTLKMNAGATAPEWVT